MLRKPLVVVVLLAVVGAVAVFLVIRSKDGIDPSERAAIIRFEQEAVPIVARARAMHKAMGSFNVRTKPSELTESRTELERARRELEAYVAPKILKPVLGRFLEGIAYSLRALVALEVPVHEGKRPTATDLATFRAELDIAKTRFARGDQLLGELKMPRALDLMLTAPPYGGASFDV